MTYKQTALGVAVWLLGFRRMAKAHSRELTFSLHDCQRFHLVNHR